VQHTFISILRLHRSHWQHSKELHLIWQLHTSWCPWHRDIIFIWGQSSLYKNIKTVGWCKVSWTGQICNLDDTEIHQEVSTITAQLAHLYDSVEQSSSISSPSPDICKTSKESFHSYCAYGPPSFLVSPSSIWPHHRISSSRLPPTSCIIFKVPKSFKPFEDVYRIQLISKKSVKHFLCLCSWFLESETKLYVCSLLHGEGGKKHIQTKQNKQNKTNNLCTELLDQLTKLNFLFINPWWSKMN
jgi:hypothetical protein